MEDGLHPVVAPGVPIPILLVIFTPARLRLPEGAGVAIRSSGEAMDY